MESILFSERIQIERKSFVLHLKQNPRGRFLVITEEVGSHRDSIIVPATGLGTLCDAIGRVPALSKDEGGAVTT